MLLKTILIFLITLLGYSEWLLGTSLIQRPIIMGTLVGLVMGNLPAGIIMGATMELAMVGAVSIGAYIPPDLVAGTILGVSLAIQSGADAAAALTLGIPIATVMLALNTAIGTPLSLIYVHKCDRDAENVNIRQFNIDMYICGYAEHVCGIIFVPLAFYFGSSTVARLLNIIPSFVQTGMEVASGLLPALGFAMLAQMVMNKKVAPFFFLGFFLVGYLKISTTGIAIFAIILVSIMLIYQNMSKENKAEKADSAGGSGFDEF